MGAEQRARVTRAKISRGQRIAMTGLATIVATGAAAVPAAAASGKIHACYSKRTDVLTYSKKGKCGHGEKAISWNASGPRGKRGASGPAGSAGAKGAQGAHGIVGAQGAQGAQGARGAAGASAAALLDAGTYLGPMTKSIPVTSGASSGEVVDAFPVTTRGYYLVHTADTVSANGSGSQRSVGCTAVDKLGHDIPMFAQPTAGHWFGEIETTGVIAASAGSTISDVCHVHSLPASGGALGTAYDVATAIDAVRGSTLNGADVARMKRVAHRFGFAGTTGPGQARGGTRPGSAPAR